ncbi:DUF397 domain-containing protein [Streptomyces sp. NPDC048383]|uniref:DUF397 domain-containing protein n=1 Tax=Streptomyces sp. NPDC048383 TaxID=3155386 RepID=UPI00342AAA80
MGGDGGLPGPPSPTSFRSWLAAPTGAGGLLPPPRRQPLPSTGWHKSTYSSDFEEACVEAHAFLDREGVLIRDSKDRERRSLTVSAAAWGTFLGPAERGLIT